MVGGTGGGHPAVRRTIFERAYPARPEVVSAIRSAVAEAADAARASRPVIDAVILACSEAATNVVMHAYRERATPGCIHVATRVESGRFSVTISDDGVGLRGRPDVESPGLGLGLAVIARLTESFDLDAQPDGGLRLQMRFLLDETPNP